MIRNCKLSDAKDICDIYNHYILHSTCTFETDVLSIEDIEQRITQYTKNNPWLVFEENSRVIGYAYANEWKPRAAYKHTKEVSVYISNKNDTKGIGAALYRELIKKMKDSGCHALIAIITLPNEPSIKFHEKFGFKKTAHLKEVGYKFNKWLDVGYWELIL